MWQKFQNGCYEGSGEGYLIQIQGVQEKAPGLWWAVSWKKEDDGRSVSGRRNGMWQDRETRGRYLVKSWGADVGSLRVRGEGQGHRGKQGRRHHTGLHSLFRVSWTFTWGQQGILGAAWESTTTGGRARQTEQCHDSACISTLTVSCAPSWNTVCMFPRIPPWAAPSPDCLQPSKAITQPGPIPN